MLGAAWSTKPPSSALESLRAHHAELRSHVAFLEWLTGARRLILAQEVPPDVQVESESCGAVVTMIVGLARADCTPEHLAAEYLGIDTDAVERERRELLDSLRRGQ